MSMMVTDRSGASTTIAVSDADAPSITTHRRNAAIRFIESYQTVLDESLCTPGWRSWSCGMGYIERDQFRRMQARFLRLFPSGFKMQVLETTAEGNRVSVLSESEGQMANGDVYKNIYLLLIRFDGDLVSEVMEFLDQGPVNKLIMPHLLSV